MIDMTVFGVAVAAAAHRAGFPAAAPRVHAAWAGAAAAQRKRHTAAADPSVDWGSI
jgi:hypothetical protein